MKSWYLAVYKENKTMFDAVALNERGMNSCLADYKLMLEHGATKVICKAYIDDVAISEEIYLSKDVG